MDKETADYLLTLVQQIEIIEGIIKWNISYNIPYKDTLKEIDRLDLLDYFSYYNDNELTDTRQTTKDAKV